MTDVSCEFAFQCDNAGTLNLNGKQIASNSAWETTTKVTANIIYGFNSITINCANYDPGGAGGCIFSCKRVSDNIVLFISDATWKMN